MTSLMVMVLTVFKEKEKVRAALDAGDLLAGSYVEQAMTVRRRMHPEQVLLLGVGRQGGDQGVETDRPLLVLDGCDFNRALGCCRGVTVGVELLVRFQVGDDRVLDIPLGDQQGVLVVDQQLLEAGVLQPDVALQAAVVEQVPPELAEQAKGIAVALEQVTSAQCAGAD